MSTLIGQGAYSCVFRPAINCNDTPSKEGSFISKITVEDQYIDNELTIAEKIKTIPNYFHFFAPIMETCPANLNKLVEKDLHDYKKCDLFKKTPAPSTPTVNEQKTETEPSIIDELTNSIKQAFSPSAPAAANITEKKFVYNKIRYIGEETLYNYFYLKKIDQQQINDVYDYLKYSIKLLQKNNIIHYDLKENNIMIHKLHHTPIIIDFGLSIDVSPFLGATNATLDQFKKIFYIYSPDYEVWCFEIHLICYLVNERKKSLDEKVLEEDVMLVIRDFENSPVFKIIKEKENYIVELQHFFIDFCNKTENAKQAILQLIGQFWKTWDMFSLGVCFLNMGIENENIIKSYMANPLLRVYI